MKAKIRIYPVLLAVLLVPLARIAFAERPNPKLIALTFDDGPHPGYTDRLLEILKEHRAQATFFVVGKQVKIHPGLVRKIAAQGHEIGNHTYTHRDLRRLSKKEVEEELAETAALVQKAANSPMRFFRPPGGRYNENVVRWSQNCGYQMALWTVLTQDHLNPPAPVILRRVFQAADSDGVVLLHSGIENTISALPELIKTLRNRGFEFVTLSQLESAKTARTQLARLP